jgi:cytochrome c oxidase assembly protein subunit 15
MNNPITSPQHSRSIAAWLLLCCVMIYAMIILGGVTRLTGSGLSMVEWDPIFGIVPPLSEQDWQSVFSKYQASPEYQKINLGMDLQGFKSIYWFEYSHRVLGRMIGTVFLLPFLFFLFRKMLPARLTPRLAFAFVLGGLQGLLGWYMVKSGLADNPHVSQYRLTAHLGLALAIYAWLFWLFLDLVNRNSSGTESTAALRRSSLLLLTLIGVTVLSGGFVAGLKAGHAYNTFPKMGDQWLPPAGWMLQPGWRNLFENLATVQFSHRLLAITTLTSVLIFGFINHRRVKTWATRLGIYLLMVVVCLQAVLGISTLLMHVPVTLAATHQGGAVFLLSCALFVAHRLRPQKSPGLY